jgi:two-component system, NarL family, response regulator NreC
MAYPESNHSRIYIVEEQEIYRRMYKASFDADSPCKLVGITTGGTRQAIEKVLVESEVSILVLGLKKMDTAVYDDLEMIHAKFPRLGLIILMMNIGVDETILLRKLLQKSRSGIALYLKQSIDNVEQINQLIQAVSHGQVVLDPAVTNHILMEKNDSTFLKNLTDRELEILNLLAKGYTNYSIAQTLFIDIKTVEHHLNSIYSKLKEDADFNQRHPRVSVARLYLETTGELIPLNNKIALPLYPA